MTPEQAAYFNAGLEAARKVAEQYATNAERRAAGHENQQAKCAALDKMEAANNVADAISALSVRTDLIAVPRDEEAIALVLYNQYRKRCHMHPVDHIGANMTPACEQCREDARAMISAWENRE